MKNVSAKSIFIIGLSGSGKTTLARLIKNRLTETNVSCFLLDADEMKDYNILNEYQGYDIISREKRAYQVCDLVKWIALQNTITISSVIGQPPHVTDYWRRNIENYYEIYLRCETEVCEKRDKKNIYSRAKKGILKNVIGIDIPFIEPSSPDLIIDSNRIDIQEQVQIVLNALTQNKN